MPEPKYLTQEEFESMLEAFLEVNEGFVFVPPIIPKRSKWLFKDAMIFMDSLRMPDKDEIQQ